MSALGVGVVVSGVVRQGLRGAYSSADVRVFPFGQEFDGVGGVLVGGESVGLSVWDLEHEDRGRWGDEVAELLHEVARVVVHGDGEADVCVTLAGPGVCSSDELGGDALPAAGGLGSYFVNHQHVIEDRVGIIVSSQIQRGCGFLLCTSEEDCSLEIAAFPSAQYCASETVSLGQVSEGARAAYEVVVGDIFAEQIVDRIHFFISCRFPDCRRAGGASPLGEEA